MHETMHTIKYGTPPFGLFPHYVKLKKYVFLRSKKEKFSNHIEVLTLLISYAVLQTFPANPYT